MRDEKWNYNSYEIWAVLFRKQTFTIFYIFCLQVKGTYFSICIKNEFTDLPD